jgi:SAM-dependent methyltransferase
MRNADSWQPSKFVEKNGRLRASRDEREVIRSSRFIADRLAGLYQSLIERHARGRLLDLGCGKVPLFATYRDRVETVTCVDWAGTMHPSPHLDLDQNLNEGLSLPDALFDTVLATDLLEHIERPDRLFASIARVLAPGGVLILTVPFLYGLHEVPHDYHRYTEYKLAGFCRDHGLEVIELSPYGGALEVLADVGARLLGKSRALSALHLGLARGLSASPIGRAVRRATERKFPLGYSLVARKRSTEPAV